MEYSALFDANGIFIETEHYILRRIQAEDAPYYKELALADTPDFLNQINGSNSPWEAAAEQAWEDLQDTTHLTCTILTKDTQHFCGFCQLQWIFSPHPELGIDLLPTFQKQGIALEVLPAFMAQAKKLLPIAYFYSKIKKDNLPSQRLAEKLGGTCVSTKSLLPEGMPPELIQFAENSDLHFLTYLEYRFP